MPEPLIKMSCSIRKISNGRLIDPNRKYRHTPKNRVQKSSKGPGQTRLHKKDGILIDALCPNKFQEKSHFSGLPGTYRPNRLVQSGMREAAEAKYSAYKTAIRRV
jgi:hypothetical protein